jgi:hypothetical protein
MDRHSDKILIFMDEFSPNTALLQIPLKNNLLYLFGLLEGYKIFVCKTDIDSHCHHSKNGKIVFVGDLKTLKNDEIKKNKKTFPHRRVEIDERLTSNFSRKPN